MPQNFSHVIDVAKKPQDVSGEATNPLSYRPSGGKTNKNFVHVL